MLNGTLIAIQRAMTCMLEHFYCEKTEVLKVPERLRPFLRREVLGRE